MSLDITLTDKEGNEIRSMNWLRNPFGLCNWAEDNVSIKPKKSLWYVINHWNYKKSNKVNRKLFKEVVDAYWEEIQKLKEGYFFFDLPAYRQFVERNIEKLHGKENTFFGGRDITRSAYDDKRRLKIPMEYFTDEAFHLSDCTLEYYRYWFERLVEFAELLQDENNVFYCSN